jgi:PD-(D/E)XK endonuclease
MAEEAPSDGIVRGGFCFLRPIIANDDHNSSRGCGRGMATGTLVGDLMASAEVGALWGMAERLVGVAESQAGLRDRARAKSNSKARSDSNSNARSRAADKSVRPTHKQLGEMAEAAFLAKVAGMGFVVACPWGDSERYDFILDVRGKMWRVQVKSSHRMGKDGMYSIRAHGHSAEAYTADEIDMLAAYVVPENVWYVFPVRALGGMRSLKLYPSSRRQRSRFEKYREAWGILRGLSR